MSEILEMDPDADVKAVIEENARDRGEDDYDILVEERVNGKLYVNVRWGSEQPTIAYLRPRKEMTTEDADQLLHAIEEYGPFRVVETGAGHWSIHREYDL